jgi:hypothetical protein
MGWPVSGVRPALLTLRLGKVVQVTQMKAISGCIFGQRGDWARFGLLYSCDGVSPNGQRILPERCVDYFEHLVIVEMGTATRGTTT